MAACAPQAAVRNHSKSVALYCAQQGLAIRCNSVHPAASMTPMWDAMLGVGPGRAEREAALVRDTPLTRFGTPTEVAHVAVYLAATSRPTRPAPSSCWTVGCSRAARQRPAPRKTDV